MGLLGKAVVNASVTRDLMFPRPWVRNTCQCGQWDNIRGRHNIRTSRGYFAGNRPHIKCDFLAPWWNLVSFKRFSLLISFFDWGIVQSKETESDWMDLWRPSKQSTDSGNIQRIRFIKIAEFLSVVIAFSQIQFEFHFYLCYLICFDTNKHVIKKLYAIWFVESSS